MMLASALRPLLIACALVLGLFIWIFNRLVRLRNRVREGASGVDVQLKRRHDLVPNLLAVVKGYAAHEQSTLEQVVEARSQADRQASATAAQADPAARQAQEAALTKSLGRLMLLVESYPEIKADKSFRQLQGELVEIEDAIQYARRYYNGTVRDYNTAMEKFPALLVAGALGHRARAFFELDAPTERAAPSVDLGTDPATG